MSANVDLINPSFIDMTIDRREFPKELRICLKVKYDKIKVEYSGHYDYIHKLNILNVIRGKIYFKNHDSNEWVEISIDKIEPYVIYQNEIITIYSKPLSLQEIYTISEKIKGEMIDIRWDFEAFCYIPFDIINDIFKDKAIGIPEPISIVRGSGLHSGRYYIEFVKNIIEPADLIKRIYLEIPLEPLSEERLDSIKNPKLREALKILFEKQKILKDALDEYYKSITSSEYKNVISKIRGAIEHLIPKKELGKIVFDIIKEALDALNIINEIIPGSNVKENKIRKIIGTLKSYSYNIYSLTSILGVHQSDYKPKPYKHDVEFLLVMALNFISYMIKILLKYNEEI